MHLASAEGNLEIIKFLIENGCNINAKDRWGNTALSEAELVLKKNIDVNTNNKFTNIINILENNIKSI